MGNFAYRLQAGQSVSRHLGADLSGQIQKFTIKTKHELLFLLFDNLYNLTQ